MAETVSTEGDRSAAPSAVTHSFDSADYECKICFNYFDSDHHVPKLLGCSHTFCQECLDILHSREGRGWRIGCPVCRHRTPVREHQVKNLPDNTALAEVLAHEKPQHESSSNTEDQTAASGTSQDASDSCETCKHVAFTVACVCAIFSFLSMVVLLFLGLIFVHNFNHIASHVGSVCLFVGSILALFTLITTWLTCMLKYRTDT